MGWDNPIVSL